MKDHETVYREYPNGDYAYDEGEGLHYHTPEAAYHFELIEPKHPLSDEPYGIDLVRSTVDDQGETREQRLPLAENRSFMAADSHIRELEDLLVQHGRETLQTEMNLVAAMPYETDEPLYLVGLYPPVQNASSATLNVLRLDGERLDIVPIARGPVAEMAAIEQRLFEVQAEGDTDVFLKAATAEAVRSQTLAPHTPLFAAEGVGLTVGTPPATGVGITLPEWEDHPDWPERSAWDQPPAPRPAALVLPVSFGNDLTPFDDQGRYVPHHQDEAGAVHFFAVVDRPSDSPLPEGSSHELRYFRAQKGADDIVIHDSQPVMPVADPATSPWPLPALSMHLEDGELGTAQSLARHVAQDNGLPFPHVLPAIEVNEPPREPEPGWYHFDTGLVVADPQGVDDGYSVGVVDVYANHENNQWAARHLPLGEFDTLDQALGHELQVLQLRTLERTSSDFAGESALYERIALAEADAALTDLLEQNDGHLPPDYEGDHEPEWEALTSKEWAAYRDYVQMITETDPAIPPMLDRLPTATPRMADETLIAGSLQPDTPYLQVLDLTFEEFPVQAGAPTWELAIVPAHDPDGEQLGYSAVCVVDFADLAEEIAPDTPERAQWLEIAQFQTEDRANQFRDDFMSLVGNDELGNITGPALAGVIADDLEMDSQWQTMDKQTLEQLKASKWRITHPAEAWQPQLDEASNPALEAASLDLDL